MEPVTILSLIMSCVLVVERCFKYFVKHVKKSNCCGSEIQFEHDNNSE